MSILKTQRVYFARRQNTFDKIAQKMKMRV